MGAKSAAIAGVVLAIAIGIVAITRQRRPVEVRTTETTRAIRIVRRDRLGVPEKKATVGDPRRVRAITEALGIDAHPSGPCPTDYADAELGVVLSGSDVYVRRNVYVFGLFGDADANISVVSVTSAGCHVGPPASLAVLRNELRSAHMLD